MKKITVWVLIIVFCIGFIPSASADSGNIKVQIAPFKTEIQGMKVDNASVEYPLITYKDITYFPMTYDLCRALYLVSGFTAEDGLYITKYPLRGRSEVPNYFGGSANNSYTKKYDAVIPTYPVYLNGIRIDNSKEEYPLINFRGITYFPMTWRFAFEELNFDVVWSDEEYSFTIKANANSPSKYPYSVKGDSMLLTDRVDVYESYINDYGDEGYSLLYSYWENYDFNTKAGTVTRLEDTPKAETHDIDTSYGRLPGEEIELTVNGNGIYYGEDLLMTVEGEHETIDPSATEYKTENGSIIYLNVYLTEPRPPYTPFKTYVVVKENGVYKALGWDEKNNWNGVFSDGNGGYYLATRGYSPVGTGRWSNSFSDVFFYKEGSGKLESLVQKYSDKFNSISAIGMANGKIYLECMWYAADKNMASSTQEADISAIASGFYAFDVNTGEMAKLYPYIYGESHIGPDGNLYRFAMYSRKARIVNINTGKVFEF